MKKLIKEAQQIISKEEIGNYLKGLPLQIAKGCIASDGYYACNLNGIKTLFN